MADFTVSDDVINSPTAKEYFGRADRRVAIGLRVSLEMLGIPVPEYAVRKPAGRPPSRAVLDAFHADHPEMHTAKPRVAAAALKAKARADKLANAEVAQDEASLFDITFNG